MRRLMLENLEGGGDMVDLPLLYQTTLESDAQEIAVKDKFLCNNRIVIAVRIPKVASPSSQDKLAVRVHTPSITTLNTVDWLGSACPDVFNAENPNGVNIMIDGLRMNDDFWVFSQYTSGMLGNGTNAKATFSIGNENTRYTNEVIDGIALSKIGYASNPKIVAGTTIKVWGR